MTVDATKPKRILVVHGVEASTDADQHQDEKPIPPSWPPIHGLTPVAQ